ncbi:MAG: NUDIX hydrolase [Patescibacteria group bacterium]
MPQNKSWKTVSTKYVYENNWIKVRHDEIVTPKGVKGIYGVVETRPFVMIIPKIKDKFYLVKLYRYATGNLSLEFPAGGIEEGEEVESALGRELQEEAGLKSNNIEKLGFLYSANGFATDGFYVYIAEACEEVERKPEDLEEGMTVEKLTLEELKRQIKTGMITDGPTVAAFCLYELNHQH